MYVGTARTIQSRPEKKSFSFYKWVKGLFFYNFIKNELVNKQTKKLTYFGFGVFGAKTEMNINKYQRAYCRKILGKKIHCRASNIHIIFPIIEPSFAVFSLFYSIFFLLPNIFIAFIVKQQAI